MTAYFDAAKNASHWHSERHKKGAHVPFGRRQLAIQDFVSLTNTTKLTIQKFRGKPTGAPGINGIRQLNLGNPDK